jgi:antitoxin MazE
MTAIKTRLVKIGNSTGIRIPKVLIDQVGLEGEVEIAVAENELIIRSSTHPRDGWDEQFRAMAKNGDDQLVDEPLATEWDKKEWTW